MKKTDWFARRIALREAHGRFEEARHLCRLAVVAAYPVGIRVRVKLGAAIVVGRVEGYGASWCDSFDVWIVNEMTAKRRKFNATFHEVELLSETESA